MKILKNKQMALKKHFSPELSTPVEQEHVTSRVKLASTALQPQLLFEIRRPSDEAAASQRSAEQSYEITVEPAENDAELSAEEISNRFETDHVVKRAPLFSEQAKDDTRTNPITYIYDQSTSLSTLTSIEKYKKQRRITTEFEAIEDTQIFLETAVQHPEVVGKDLVQTAQEMLTTMTFIGEKEYAEAAEGIATYWKECLRKNKDLELLVLVGQIPRESKDDLVKSDDYVLDRILSNFSVADMQEFKGRIILSPEDVSVKDPHNLKAVLLDDWTISGEQLADARKLFLFEHPDFLSSLEVQLLVANQARITTGLEIDNDNSTYNSPYSTPVRAYYLAHASKAVKNVNKAHITGAHSSVDYEFEDICKEICDRTESYYATKFEDGLYDSLATMPQLTNIVRPYRFDHIKLKNRNRVRNSRQPV